MSALAPNVEERFIYVDWTLEEQPRAFYVGKGNVRRVRKRERNAYWKNIAAKYGWRREIVLATKDESFAFEEEKRLIREHKTFYGASDYVWGANKTEGGEGRSGSRPSQATRNKMSAAHRGRSVSDVTRSRMSLSQKGRAVPEERRQKIADALRGKPSANKGRPGHLQSEETKAKISATCSGRTVSAATKHKMSEANRGERGSASKLTWLDVEFIRQSSLKQSELAEMYNVSRAAIGKIQRHETWKRLEPST